MNKSIIVSLICIVFLFSGCDTKTTIDSSVIAKTKSVEQQQVEFESQSFALITTNEKFISFRSTPEGLDFDEFKGKKAVLIDVFATWCEPCIKSIPNLKELKEKYKDDFEIVSVLFEEDKTKEEIEEFIKKYGINYPITMGEENFRLAKELGDIKRVPEMFLFSKDGKFVNKFVGEINKENLERFIKLAIEN